MLTDSALVRLGIDGKDDRKTALAAFREAGFVKPPQRQTQSGSKSWAETKVKDEKGNGAGAAARPRAVGGSLATKDLGAGSSSRIKKMMSGKVCLVAYLFVLVWYRFFFLRTRDEAAPRKEGKKERWW